MTGRHRVYLDACCLNRPFDDQSQDRIRLEAEAVRLVLSHAEVGEWDWIGSEALTYETSQIPDGDRRRRMEVLLASAGAVVTVGDTEVDRAHELTSLGFHPVDALHIACAERGEATVCLTTDDRFLARARRMARTLRVRVANPLAWLEEMT